MLCTMATVKKAITRRTIQPSERWNDIRYQRFHMMKELKIYNGNPQNSICIGLYEWCQSQNTTHHQYEVTKEKWMNRSDCKVYDKW